MKCVICGDNLNGQKKKYCSNKCKQKNHYHKVKSQQNTYHSQTLRSYRRKIKLIDMMGGGCNECDYNYNISALDFHHIDSKTKKFTLCSRNLSNKKWEDIIIESKKCKLLCTNCHREMHNPESTYDNVMLIIENNKIKRREINKPKCRDCNIEINYNSKRCTVCNNIDKRLSKRPLANILLVEFNKHGVAWCSNKYNVSRTTVKRWLKLL